MAKKKEIIVSNNLDLTLDDIMSDRFGRYSKYIIQERALPDARDGLKPVQRRILYAMHYDGNTADKAHRKSAKTVGLVIGTFHPHGDSSVYEAMVRMSQDWKVNLPLIDIHGNNGSIDDDPAAAMRYTEARLSINSSLLLEDIDKKTVAMTNNYDDTEMEPTVLPARFPLLLVNGSTGIASGYATNIAPHNLNEVVNATIYRLNHPESSIDELMEFVKGPDFPTGGIVQGKDAIREIFATGKGKVVLRSKCEIVSEKTCDQIIVSEIPFEVIKCQLVKKITDIYLNKDIDGIMDVRDESGRAGLRIVIDLKKGSNGEQILNYLYKNTDLQINYNYNSIAIVDHRPMMLSLDKALDVFIAHRREVVLNRSVYLRDKKKARLHIIEGLIKAISILDSVIELIRKSKDKKNVKENLMSAFLFTEIQAEAIATLQLYRLSNTDITQLKEEFALLTKEISELEAIISSKEVLDALLVRELKEVNTKIVTPRKTKIEEKVSEVVVDRLAMIANEACYISLSKDGYIKRFSPRAFNANEKQLPFTKESDELIGVRSAETLDTLLIFTNKGNYAYLPVYRLDECRFKDLGKHVSTYVKMENGEKVVGAVLAKNMNSFAFIITATKSGMVKKTLLQRFDVQRASKVMTAMKLKANDEMIYASIAYSGDDIVLASADGYYNRYSVDLLSDIAPKALGVGGISVKNDTLAAAVIDHHDGSQLLVVSKKGMKRIHHADMATTNRNVKGLRLFKQIKTNPHSVTYLKSVYAYNNLIISKSDESKEINVSSIPFMNTEQSFSSFDELNGGFYLNMDDMSDIPEARVIEIPTDYFDTDQGPDQTSIFDEGLI